MKMKRLDHCLQKKVTLLSALAPVAVCTFALVLNSAAQTAAPAPAPAQAVAKANSSGLKFKAPSIPTLKAGVPTAFNLCNGQAIQGLPAKFSDADGLKLDNAQTPCGEQVNATPSVAGGNGPYHFQMDSGSFPPLGMHLGMNGLLYGTPAPPTLGGYKPFRVCAVDLSANADCHEVTIQAQAATPPKAAHSAVVPLALIGGAAVLGGAYAVHQMNNPSSSSGSGVSAGQCDGFGSTINSCGPCSCDPNGSGSTACPDSSQCGGGQCFNYSSDGNQKAPFC
ncbi:MAG: hypothetical protein ACYDDS_10275 [Candidatus Sulfotelmatobacter sp.]